MHESDPTRHTPRLTCRAALRVLALGAALVLLVGLPVAGADRDGDGLKDGFEERWGVTSPDSPDTDGDGVIDSAEDNDGDLLGNIGEMRSGTDPGSRDSDGDGIPDNREDADGDGVSNGAQQDRRRIPAGLTPSLTAARLDRSPDRDRCMTPRGSNAVKRCWFGKKGGPTIVLMGDSHAVAWLPAMKAATNQRGWRLITQLKGGCSPYVGVRTGSGFACHKWRKNALAWLRTYRPDLIVFAHSDNYRLLNEKGGIVPSTKKPKVWKEGLWQTLATLPSASEVLVLGDIPDNAGNPVQCLKEHRYNMSACTARRLPPAQRPVEDALRRGAIAAGAQFRTLYGRICTYDACPLVHGQVLMYRDHGHITRTFSLRLTPSMRDLLAAALDEAGVATRRRS